MRGMATIYLALKDEGVDVWRPVEATDQGGGIYRISDAPIPDREMWEFAPGSPVRCERRQLSDGPAVVAVALA